jgi:hypothetical protein
VNVGLVIPALVVLVIVARMVLLMRGRRLREKYVWGWFALALAIGVVGLVPGLAAYLTTALGFQLPSNMILGGAMVLLLFLSLGFSVELSRLDDDRRRLVEELALTNAEVSDLRRRVDELGAPERPRAE